MSMERKQDIERREFLRTSTAAMLTGLGASGGLKATEQAVEEAARKVGRLPRHKLGSGGREVSVLVGAGDWAREAVAAGVLCGVNFWHKSDDWEAQDVQPAILKNRDAHYCQVSIDRVRGNHETGQIDEEAHYQFVKNALKRTGLRYFDDMQLHFGYHSTSELRNNRAFIRAFERLKREGLVRHLCLSQHNYNGNSRVSGGESAAEILTAVIADGVYEHAQFFYSYGEDTAVNELVALAKRKGFGTIAMKSTRGAGRMSRDAAFMKDFPAGTTPHHALARWLTTRAQIDAAVIRLNNLNQFVDTCSGAGKDMRAADSRAIERMTEYADHEVCRLCNECLSYCGQRIPVADVLRYERYATDYGDGERARFLYTLLNRQAHLCDACGSCLPHCPQGLDIPEKLAEAHRILS
jgi:predicted aldo/keto reductase-like oxidoreductase